MSTVRDCALLADRRPTTRTPGTRLSRSITWLASASQNTASSACDERLSNGSTANEPRLRTGDFAARRERRGR